MKKFANIQKYDKELYSYMIQEERRQKDVLDSGAAHLKKRDVVLAGEFAATLDDLGALDVFGRREVIHHEYHFLGIPDSRAFDFLELLNGHYARQFRGHDNIHAGVDELPGVHFLFAAVRGENLLG